MFREFRGLFRHRRRVLLAQRYRTFPAGTQHAALVCAMYTEEGKSVGAQEGSAKGGRG